MPAATPAPSDRITSPRASPAHRPGQVRLLVDECVSPSVGRALRAIGEKVLLSIDEVGVGASDIKVVEFARRRSCIIVTENHDLMVWAAGQGVRFVWLDARSRSLRLAEQVLLLFNQIDHWATLLERHPTLCVHAGRTFCDVIEPSEASRRARARMVRRRRADERRKRKRNGHDQGLLDFR